MIYAIIGQRVKNGSSFSVKPHTCRLCEHSSVLNSHKNSLSHPFQAELKYTPITHPHPPTQREGYLPSLKPRSSDKISSFSFCPLKLLPNEWALSFQNEKRDVKMKQRHDGYDRGRAVTSLVFSCDMLTCWRMSVLVMRSLFWKTWFNSRWKFNTLFLWCLSHWQPPW